MIHILYTLIFSEMVIILILLFKTPLRKLVIITLDKLKRGKGPIMVKTVAATICALFTSNCYTMKKIGERVDDTGMVNPTDQVLLSRTLLEASLMGFLLFLSLMIDRLHHYIRELRQLRKTMEVAKKQNRSFEDGKNGSGSGSGNIGDGKSMGDEIANLKTKIKDLESECETKTRELKATESNAEALKKQTDGFISEHGRLLEDNQNLRNQLQLLDQST